MKKNSMIEYILETPTYIHSIIDNSETDLKFILKSIVDYKVDRVYIVGSGSSYHAGCAAKAILGDICNIEVSVFYPIYFKDYVKCIDDRTLVIGISQGGQSYSTIAALRKANEYHATTVAISANIDAPLMEEAKYKLLLKIGIETIGPKTKGYYCSMVTVVMLILEYLKSMEKLDLVKFSETKRELISVFDNFDVIVESSLQWYERNKVDLLRAQRIIIVGYDKMNSTLMEGRLKLIETIRYGVEYYEFEEFLHGIYHSISMNDCLICLGSESEYYPRLANMHDYFKGKTAFNYMISNDCHNISDKNLNAGFICSDNCFIQYLIPLQVLSEKLSSDLGIDCTISSDADFHYKMGSYIQ